MTATPGSEAGNGRSRPLRYLYAALGLLSYGLGAVGAFVPGLPTTSFLIVGSWFLVRSCPELERRLMQSRLFRPYARYLEPGAVMPFRARVISIAMMWSMIGFSSWLIHQRGGLRPWLAAVLVGCGVVGTVLISRFRRAPRPSAG